MNEERGTTELVSIGDMPKPLKIMMLNELGYHSDGTFVLTQKGEKCLDRYTNEPIKIDNMAIFPMFPKGAIILDNNPLSISSYLEDFPEVIFFGEGDTKECG